MKCRRCQQENPPGAKFCIACATPLVRAGVQCGTPLPPDARFCPECARPTGESAATRPRFVPVGGLPSITTFTRDGKVIETPGTPLVGPLPVLRVSPGLGTWKYLGGRHYTAAFTFS